MKRWQAPVLAAGVGLALRALYLFQSSEAPSFLIPVVDAESYHSLALELARGELPARLFYQGSFYPLFLAGLHWLSNGSILFAKCIQVALGVATCALTTILGRRLFDERVGLAAGLVTALNAPLFFFEAELLATGWSAFWSVALLWLVLDADERAGSPAAAFFGLVAALAAITRPTFLPICVLAAAWLVLRARTRLTTRAARTRLLLAMGAGFAVVAVPFAIVNGSVTGGYSLAPHSGGLNLYIGNNPKRAETVATRPADFYRITELPEQHGIREVSERQRFYTRRVVDYVLSDPIDFAGGLLTKTLEFASPRELPRNVDVYVFREWSPLLAALVWKAGPWGFPSGLLFPLALAGLMLHWRQLPTPVKWFPILYSASIIAVFVSARYRVALTPIMAILACGGVAQLAGDWAAGRKGRALAWVALAAVGSVLSALPGPFLQEEDDYAAELHYAVGTQLIGSAEQARERGSIQVAEEREAQAREQLAIALERDPDYAHAHANLGVLAYRLGDYEEADRHFQRALRSDPSNPVALQGRTRSLKALGRSIEASRQAREAVRRMEAARARALEP